MDIKNLTQDLSVAAQITAADIPELARLGFKALISNRPDGEGADQPLFSEIADAAQKLGIEARYIPVASGQVSDANVNAFKAALVDLPKPILAYCRTGTRSATLWSLSQAGARPLDEILQRTRLAGYDMSGVAERIVNGGQISQLGPAAKHDIVIVGGGAAGVAVAASLLKRQRNLDIAIIDPAEIHYYQPGWTLVGAGVFKPRQTRKSMASVLPRQVTWIKAAVAGFMPENNSVVIEGCRTITYNQLVVCPGLKLNWSSIEGLAETIGKNGVTSNYRYDLAPYTWELVQNLKSGRAIFTQPPMPIKCAGAPQKAMYLSADYWLNSGKLRNIDIEFYNAGGVLFGVADYVPALMTYIKKYAIELNFAHTLVKVDGPAKKAWFLKSCPDGTKELVETSFEMLHVAPPQAAPDFIRASPLADENGWINVDQTTLRHKTYANIFGLGDAANTPNAKTVAAARKQAPVVAENLLFNKGARTQQCSYDGYGSCPLTVERGKIVLAEFLYGGKVTSSFPNFLIDGTKPSRLAWISKGAYPSADLLEGHAQGPRMDGQTESHGVMPIQDVLATFSGSLVGFVLGLVGGGGSILAVPLLVYLVGVSSPHVAIGTSAVAVALSAVANLIGHARLGNVKWRCALVFAAAGIVGAALGSTFGKQFDGQKLLVLFGALMIVIAALMFFKKSTEGNFDVRLNRKSAPDLMPYLLVYGVGVGALSGFFGIGGGFLVVPGLMAATEMPLIFAIGSSLVSVAAFGFTTAGNYALSGLIDWTLAAFFIIGGIAGGVVGRQVAIKLAPRKQLLSQIFAVIVACAGVYVVFRGWAALSS